MDCKHARRGLRIRINKKIFKITVHKSPKAACCKWP